MSIGRARALVVAGVATVVASTAVPYVRVGGGPVWLPLGSGRLDAHLAVAASLLVGAAVSLVDRTRGEQVLGTVAGGLAAAVGVGRVVGVPLSGGPGLAAAVVAWGTVETADLLDPALTHPGAPREAAVTAVGASVAATVGFLLGPGPVRFAAAPVAVGAWLYAVRWELAAERG